MRTKIKRYCEVTGAIEEMFIDSTPDLKVRIKNWDTQYVFTENMVGIFFGDLNPDEREFIVTGITPEVRLEIFDTLK